jgi:hypothetical protein
MSTGFGQRLWGFGSLTKLLFEKYIFNTLSQLTFQREYYCDSLETKQDIVIYISQKLTSKRSMMNVS